MYTAMQVVWIIGAILACWIVSSAILVTIICMNSSRLTRTEEELERIRQVIQFSASETEMIKGQRQEEYEEIERTGGFDEDTS